MREKSNTTVLRGLLPSDPVNRRGEAAIRLSLDFPSLLLPSHSTFLSLELSFPSLSLLSFPLTLLSPTFFPSLHFSLPLTLLSPLSPLLPPYITPFSSVYPFPCFAFCPVPTYPLTSLPSPSIFSFSFSSLPLSTLFPSPLSLSLTLFPHSPLSFLCPLSLPHSTTHFSFPFLFSSPRPEH